MKLIIGIGNPGEKYKNTRHNVGFMAIDALVSKTQNLKLKSPYSAKASVGKQNYNLKFKSEKKFSAEVLRAGDVILAKPQTFMNESGKAVASLATYYKIPATEIYVIHDDLDLRLGECKIQKGIGPKLHYGIQSIEDKLGRKDFWRVRIGVDNRDSENRIQGETYVLQEFTEEERMVVNETIDKLLIDLINLISK